MDVRLGRAGRWLWVLILSAVRLILRFLLRLMGIIWRAMGLAGLQLRRVLARLANALWAYLGLLGLALRNVLTTILWSPLLRVAKRVAAAANAFWRFVGRLGLALRKVLDRFVWRPMLFVTAPIRWIYRKFLSRPVNFMRMSLLAFAEWMVVHVLLPVSRVCWQAFLERWPSWRTRVDPRSYLPRVHIQVSVQRPTDQSPVDNIGFESHTPLRLNRFATALVTTGVVLFLGIITSQAREPVDVAASSNFLSKPILTVTPAATPVATVEPTQVPTLTPQPARISASSADDFAQRNVWPTPDPLSKGGSVVFTLRKSGNSDIYALMIGRTEPIRLTSHRAEDRDPVWSPDGKRLAFASRRDGNWEIYTLDLQSGQLLRLTNDPSFDAGPSWSPDGEWLVYESYKNNNLDLYIIPSDGGSTPIRLTEHPSLDYAPAWSPGGRHIAFTSWRSGNKDIFIMSLDTASDEFAANVTMTPDVDEDHATFAPGERYLAYHGENDGIQLVYVTPLANYAPEAPPLSVGQGRHPSWAPDGKSLIYVYSNESLSYLLASSIDAWNVAPQAFTSPGYIDDLSWSGMTIQPELVVGLPEVVAEDQPLFVEGLSPARENGPPYLLWEIGVNAPSPYLSDRVDQSFEALRQRIVAETGWDFLGQVDAMFASLDSKPSPGEPNRSWNKAGRAFDFYSRYPISVDPQVEIVREDLGANTYWRVFLKTANQDGTQGEPMRHLSWDFQARYDSEPRYYDQGGKWKESMPSGYYVDFTALAADFGWTRVPASDNWRTFFQGIRFWHMENRQGLAWEDAMLEIYTADEIAEALGNP